MLKMEHRCSVLRLCDGNHASCFIADIVLQKDYGYFSLVLIKYENEIST